jgi:hypothetical protein
MILETVNSSLRILADQEASFYALLWKDVGVSILKRNNRK